MTLEEEKAELLILCRGAVQSVPMPIAIHTAVHEALTLLVIEAERPGFFEDNRLIYTRCSTTLRNFVRS